MHIKFRLSGAKMVLDTTICDKVCQWIVVGQWFSPGTPVSSTKKTDRHDITEILLKVALNTINHKKNGCSRIKFKYRLSKDLLTLAILISVWKTYRPGDGLKLVFQEHGELSGSEIVLKSSSKNIYL